METIQIEDENGKVYKFKKPEFKCELLAIVDEYIIGYYEESYKSIKGTHKIPIFWNIETGNCYKGGGVSNIRYCLTPKKSEWYEDENNFPAFIISDYGIMEIAQRFNTEKQRFYFRDIYYGNVSNGWRLATKQERDSLFCYDK